MLPYYTCDTYAYPLLGHFQNDNLTGLGGPNLLLVSYALLYRRHHVHVLTLDLMQLRVRGSHCHLLLPVLLLLPHIHRRTLPQHR